jgi:outer membrane protein assembly factor BamA
VIAAICAAALLLAQAPAPTAASTEVIAELLVHGNHLTPDEEVIRLAGVRVGDVVLPTTIDDVTARLRGAKRFESVQVLKRFASITDPSRITVVIIVDDGPVKVEMPHEPGAPVRVVRRNSLTNFMIVPLLDGEDGYGFTYGAQLAYAHVAGRSSRLSFPLTWGGRRHAGMELERTFARGPFSRIQIGSAIQEERNPAYLENDTRRRLWITVERPVGPLRLDAGTGWQHVSFAGADDDLKTVSAGATVDTRLSKLLPRNAVYLNTEWTRVGFGSGGVANRSHLEAQGDLGLIGQMVVEARVVREDTDRALPPYLKPLLGGWTNLRGFEAGSFAGDILAAGSLELRIPLSSPLNVARVGVSAFVDTGKSYDKGTRYHDVAYRTGVGGGVWVTAAVFHMGLAAAHGIGAGTRVNFDLGLEF